MFYTDYPVIPPSNRDYFFLHFPTRKLRHREIKANGQQGSGAVFQPTVSRCRTWCSGHCEARTTLKRFHSNCSLLLGEVLSAMSNMPNQLFV